MDHCNPDSVIEHRQPAPVHNCRGQLARRALRGILLACVSATASACRPTTPDPCAPIRAAEQALREAFDQFVIEEQLSDEEIQSLVIDEMPVELDIVLADVARFATTQDHPLYDVQPATLADADSLAFLNGCWGRLATESRFGDAANGIDPIAVELAEAWRVELFDADFELLATEFQTINVHTLEGIGGMPCRGDDRPVLQSSTNSVTQASNTEIRMTVVNAKAAGVSDDGSLSLHEVGTAQASVAIGVETAFLFSVQGDFLVTSGPGYDPEQPSVDALKFWVRFECTR